MDSTTHTGDAARSSAAVLDLTRRSRYLALLRRWTHECLPAGTRAAADATERLRRALAQTADAGGGGSVLVRMRARLVAERARGSRAQVRASALPRVEQLIGRERLEAWEGALAAMPERQRELVILRIEFGLDFAAIAEETGLGAETARIETVNALAALIDTLRRAPDYRAA